MFFIPPLPRSGAVPRQELVPWDMIKRAEYIPLIPRDDLRQSQTNMDASIKQAPPGEIITRPHEDHYEVLIGWEYLTAYRLIAPGKDIPISIYHYTDFEAVDVGIRLGGAAQGWSQIQLIDAYKGAMQHFSWRRIQLATALGEARSTISNWLKLSELEDSIKKHISAGRLTIEHGKILSRLSPAERTRLVKLTLDNKWDTRTLYGHAHPEWKPKNNQAKTPELKKDSDHLRLEQTFSEVLGNPVNIDVDKQNGYSGGMEIKFFGFSELAGLVQKIEQSTKAEHRWKGEIRFSIESLDHLEGILGDLYQEDF